MTHSLSTVIHAVVMWTFCQGNDYSKFAIWVRRRKWSFNDFLEKGKIFKNKKRQNERFTPSCVISSLRSCHKGSLMARPFLSSFLLQTTINVQHTLNKDKNALFSD